MQVRVVISIPGNVVDERQGRGLFEGMKTEHGKAIKA